MSTNSKAIVEHRRPKSGDHICQTFFFFSMSRTDFVAGVSHRDHLGTHKSRPGMVDLRHMPDIIPWPETTFKTSRTASHQTNLEPRPSPFP